MLIAIITRLICSTSINRSILIPTHNSNIILHKTEINTFKTVAKNVANCEADNDVSGSSLDTGGHCPNQTWGQILLYLYLNVFKYFFFEYLYLYLKYKIRKYLYLYLNTFVKYLELSNPFSNTFSNLFQILHHVAQFDN